MKHDVATEQATLPRTALFVRISAEIAALAVVVAIIGVSYLLYYPSLIILQQPVVDAQSDQSNSVALTWTAPGDDGLIGQATTYDIRYSTQELNEANWSSATPVASPPAPQSVGAQETLDVTGLTPATTYYFALKTADEVGNQSAISNIATARTSCIEAWSCADWTACNNGNQTRVCSDLNSCGTTDTKPPEERNCTPCIEDWVCSDWSACSNGGQTRTCVDQNGCGTTDTKPEETQSCGAGGGDTQFQDTFVVVTPNKGGGPQVRILTKEGKLEAQFFAYAKSFRGGVNLAVGDIGADDIDEIITAPGPGREPLVRIFRKNGSLINQFYAFDKSFRGGVTVAMGDVDGRPGKEIIVSSASKGAPDVRIFGYRDGTYSQVIPSFSAYSRRLRGTWNLAAADLDGDGKDEIVTIPGENTSSSVMKYFAHDGRRMVQKTNGVTVFPRGFKGGVNIAAADLDGNGRDEVLAVPEGRGGPQLRILGRRANGSFAIISNGFLLFHKDFKGGVSIASGDVDFNNRDEIVAAVHSGDQALVRITRADGKRIYYEFLAFPKEVKTGVTIATGQFYPPQ